MDEPVSRNVATLTAGAAYFLIVFAAGFVLGPIRLLWVVPRFGTRIAELLEAPIMFAVIFLAARWMIGHPAALLSRPGRLAAGLFALALMLTVEFGLVVWLRGITVDQYLAERDPVSGTVYYVLLAVFAAMPTLVRRH